ncbi:MAG: inositol monophosphatase [Alphaproteobacteria bacterium]|nr:inositol monophosphatase [Alphaproteobacteria bacterium]
MTAAPDLASLLTHAAAIARDAGAALLDHRAAWATIDDVQGREVKLAADRKAEDLIVARLRALAPYKILSEETGWIAGGEEGAYAWALDPLDGSVNYLQNFPHWGVSIALLRDGDPVLGVVHLPALDECFVGAVGFGATLNGRPISVSTVDHPGRGVLVTGIPARAKTDEAGFSAFMSSMLAWRKVRMIGSAAAALAYVAAGRADAYRETGAMLWDVAGGCALVKAAGGAATIEGAALDAPLLVRAGNGRVGV